MVFDCAIINESKLEEAARSHDAPRGSRTADHAVGAYFCTPSFGKHAALKSTFFLLEASSSPGLEPNSAKRNSWWQRRDGGPPGALRQQSDPGPGFVPSASPAVSCHAMHSTFPHIGLQDHRTLRASVKDASFDLKTEHRVI
ncbi:uncharacterized protein LOC119384785 [Rhipicephalus sanguineus]|uniref:uncharacterized protein LOC119384785 n=1 Tax=Rhipicephalus sanguineus TaxID=34632 RepID=UPI0018947381|nr:uncharacterized protein LOC119384785 [Rhipicephalus sanguineus]